MKIRHAGKSKASEHDHPKVCIFTTDYEIDYVIPIKITLDALGLLGNLLR